MPFVSRSPARHRTARSGCQRPDVLIGLDTPDVLDARAALSPTATDVDAPGAAPRVLVAAAGAGRAALAAGLAGEGIGVLLVAPDQVAHQVLRGGVDLVLLRGEGNRLLAELAALREVSAVPVLVSLRDGRSSLEPFLTAGADDCVARGVGRFELAARVRAILRRRAHAVPGEVLRVGPFTLDLARHLFSAAGKPVHLPPKEFGLLELLMRRDGRVVGRQEALQRVWAAPEGSDPTTVDVHVKRLRAKLEPDPGQPRHLLTVRGLGYRFQA